MEVGKQYLLFADKVEGRLTITNCGNSALLADTNGHIRELRSVRIPSDALIEGRISFSDIPDSGAHVEGVVVTVRSGSHTFKAVSNRMGWFRLYVPPGRYTVDVKQIPRWIISPYDLSYNDPAKFIARQRHCSGLQFVANPAAP